jgi:hypothetical protein
MNTSHSLAGVQGLRTGPTAPAQSIHLDERGAWAKWLLARIGWWLAGPVLLASLAACASLGESVEEARQFKTPEELLRAAVKLAQAGSRAVCSPSIVGAALGLRFGALKLGHFDRRNETGIETVAVEGTHDVQGLNPALPIDSANLYKRSSPSGIECMVRISYVQQMFCNRKSTEFQSLMEAQLSFGYPSPGRLQYQAYVFEYLGDGETSAIILGDTSQPHCSRSLTIKSTRG